MAGTVRDWPWSSVMAYINANGKDIKDLALKGDRIALATYRAYHEAAKHRNSDGTIGAPVGSREHLTLCDALNDYFLRDQQIKERIRLAEKFCHRIEDSKEGPGILLLN